ALAETAALAGDGFLPVQCDIADPAQVATAFSQARAWGGPVRRLINNAALYPRRDFLDETGDSFMQTVAVNLGGLASCSSEALKDMVAAGQGRIMNVATFADIAPLPGSAAYSVSKGAARIFTRALVADLQDRFDNIVINDWMPGMLKTQMGIADGLDPATSAHWGAELALMDDPTLNGTTWEMDCEIPPHASLKRRIAEKLRLVAKRPARKLG
ncbi:MAG: SDR family oxidoreductase, partial [Rhodobacteraceae bacterium]|nr:SDR family oxidoreductase [Paracoccaceae bacterium]